MLNRDQKQRLISALGVMFSSSDFVFGEEFCRLAEAAGYEALLYWRSGGMLTPRFAHFKERYRRMAAGQIRQEHELCRLYALLEEHRLPFAPIKGADLAFRIYPVSALRPFGDWDIWVPSRELKRFCQILADNGWLCPLDCSSDHHCGMRHKGAFHLEPHFHLPNFQHASARKLWEETIPAAGKQYERRLSPELNLIMLCQHNAIASYRSGNLLKLLVDMEFLLTSTPVNWEKTTRLCFEYQVPHPGLLIRAFPEFFRERHVCGINFPHDVISALRELLLTSEKFRDDSSEINALAAEPFQPSWWKIHLRRLSDENLKWKYHLPADSGTIVHFYRLWDIMRKSFFFLRYMKSKPSDGLMHYFKEVCKVDSSWKLLPSGNCEKCDGHLCSSSMPYCPYEQEKSTPPQTVNGGREVAAEDEARR